MSYDKYYDEFYRDGKLNNKFITYLSAIDMQNKLLNRDVLKNIPIEDLCSNYAKKASYFYNGIKSTLDFIQDDIQVIYNYAINHLDSILDKPNQSIIKEQKLVSKEKIKQIEPKTFNWLANKPGISIKEKLAYVNKISSPVKRYTNNIKENQVTLAFFKDIYKILISKISLIENNKDIFGESNDEVIQLKNKLNKLKYKFKNEFEEVVEKDYTIPNNTLLGNKDYSVIWKSYLDLKQNTLSYYNYFELYIKSFKLMFISLLINNYDFIEQKLNINDLSQNILYNIKNDKLEEITFDANQVFTIAVKEYLLKNKINLISTKTYAIKFEEIEEASNGGILFNLYINDELIDKFNADNLGFKNAFFKLCDYLSLSVNPIIKNSNAKEYIEWISLNSFDNSLYPSDKNITATNDNSIFINNDIYFANKETISLNDFNNDNYLSYLRLLRNDFETKDNEYLIYDISDNYDEFSSTKLRRNISSVFNKSYPVWRSILAGESLESKTNIEYIIDMCGKDKSIVLSKLERKNNRFVHCGVIETPIYLQNFNEYDFYKSYTRKYEEKYSLNFPNEIIDSFINSGKLNLLLQQKLDNIILLNGNISNHEYYIIKFDEEIFNDVCLEFIKSLRQITTYYDEDKCVVIVPNFLRNLALKSSLFICNDDLIKGAKTIAQRVKNNEITWYEKLPKLSLEVIKNGMYDNLVLVDNQECKNIIGQSITFEVQETLTLSKGENNYILPLNKSFLGDNNESFVAIAEDKSFPLQEDINVKLLLTYSFGSENSYLLKLIPIESAPFKSIDVKWEKEAKEVKIINPKIKNTKYTYEEINKLLTDFEITSQELYNLRKNNVFHIKNFNNYIKRSKYMSNDYGRMINFSEEIKDRANKVAQDYEVAKNFKFLKKILISNKNFNDFDLVTLEQSIATFESETKYFNRKNSKTFIHVENCYGRYLSNKYSLDVYGLLIEDLTNELSLEEYLYNERIHQLISSITDIIASNYLRFCELANENVNITKMLLKSITKLLGDISSINFDNLNEFKDDYYRKRFVRNLGYSIRQSVEIIISFLFLRNRILFEELNPNGKISKELIYYLKLINKNYYVNYEKFFDINDKKPRLNTKYNMTFEDEKNELYNTWIEIYCLILYLSGDERANYIKIGGE